MRKLLALVLAAVMLASVGCAWAEETAADKVEITFQGIPWGSSEAEVREWIKNAKLLLDLRTLNSTKLYSDGLPYRYMTSDGEFDYQRTYPQVTKVLHFEASCDLEFKIAGYSLYAITFVFAGNDDVTRLISVDITIDRSIAVTEAFADLQQKLRTVYGPGNLDDDSTYLKLGENNTAVRLDYNDSFFGAWCNLFYGDTTAAAILKEMPATVTHIIDSTDVSGL